MTLRRASADEGFASYGIRARLERPSSVRLRLLRDIRAHGNGQSTRTLRREAEEDDDCHCALAGPLAGPRRGA